MLNAEIHNAITETITNTPLVRLARLREATGCKADLVGKARVFQPVG